LTEITSIIGSNLKNIRKTRQLTLETVSKMTGVSVSMLGELERGVTNPTITLLWKIADGLKISFSDLTASEIPPVSVVRHKEAVLFIEGDGFKITTFFPFESRKKFEILHKTLEPGAVFESAGHRPGVEEYLLICDGRINLLVGDEQIILEKGDAIRFNGNMKHRYQNAGDSPVNAFTILYYGPEVE